MEAIKAQAAIREQEVEREKEETFVNEEGKTSRRKKRKSKKEIIAEQDSSTTAKRAQGPQAALFAYHYIDIDHDATEPARMGPRIGPARPRGH